MPVITVRFDEDELVPIRAYADRCHRGKISTAIKALCKSGIRGELGIQSDADKTLKRVDAALPVILETLMISRITVGENDPGIIKRAREAALEYHKRLYL